MRRCRTVVGGNGISVISSLYYMHLEKKKELLSYDIMLLNLMAVLQINPPADIADIIEPTVFLRITRNYSITKNISPQICEVPLLSILMALK